MDIFKTELDKAVLMGDVCKVRDVLDTSSEHSNEAIHTEARNIVNNVLYLATRESNLEIVKVLLQKGADVTYANSFKQSVLTNVKSEEIAECLIEAGADINHTNINGMTDLMHLMAGGVLSYANLVNIVDSVVNVNERDPRTGGTFIHMVCNRTHDENKADVIEKLLKLGIDVNSIDNNDDTPLHLMATVACSRSIKLLLDNGADITARNRLGETVLHSLASSNAFEGFTETLNLLIQKQVDINEVDYQGRTAIHHSLFSKETTCAAIDAFVQYEIKMNISDCSGRNEIFYAVDDVNFEYSETELETRAAIIKRLVEAGVEVSNSDLYGITPLHNSTMRDGLDSQVALLESGADITKRTNTGATPLHWACQSYNKFHVMVYYYIKGKHDINCKDNYGSTPLHWAVWYNNLDAAQTLLQIGADDNSKDENGESSADLARTLHFHQFFKLIDTYKALDKLQLRENILICDKDIFKACPLLRYTRRANGKLLDIADYIKHVQSHKTSLREFIKTVLNANNMGYYYDIVENQTVPELIQKLMDLLSANVSKRNPLFRSEVRVAGSSYEGTKVNLPDEFDYLWNLKEFEKSFIPVESKRFPDGYIKLLLKDKKERHRFADYINTEDYLDCKVLLRHFYGLVNKELLVIFKDDTMNAHFSRLVSEKLLDEIVGNLSSLTFHYFGSQAKFLEISVDVVPTIWLGEWRPEGFSCEHKLSSIADSQMFSVVFKTPERYLVQSFTLFYRLSYAYFEQIIIKHEEEDVKKGYMILKALIESGYLPQVFEHGEANRKTIMKQIITSYRIKTCLLHALHESKQNEVYECIYSRLGSRSKPLEWAHRIVSYFEKFVQAQFMPAYFDAGKTLLGLEGFFWTKELRGSVEGSVSKELIMLLKLMLEMC